MEDKLDVSKAAATIKLFISSLFARKLPGMIVSYTTPGTFFFTNINSERIKLYKATPEDVLSKVTVVSKDVIDILYNAFPVFKTSVCEVFVSLFSTQLNKALAADKTKFPELVADVPSRELRMIRADKDEGTVTVVVGRLLPEWDAEFYNELLDKFEKFSTNVITRSFTVSDSQMSSSVALEIVEVTGKSDTSTFGLPVSDGLNLVSAREYIKKRSLDPIYQLLLQFDELTRTSKATIQYIDDWFNVKSIMPGSLWFMTRKVL